MKNKKIKLCLAASSGGHFEQLMMLKPLMNKYDKFVMTERTNYNVEITGIKTYYLRQINRKEKMFLPKLIINTLSSLGAFIKEKPDVIICTGVLAMVPMCLIMKMLGKRLIYIESFAKVTSPTLTGRILYKYADQFYIQWEGLKRFYPNAIYCGGIY
jgi:UDP-N-acetylglucosamine:LPS N-acetylglucosamine transferase